MQRAMTPPYALLYPQPVVASIPPGPALASGALTHLRYLFKMSTVNQNLNTMVNTELHCVHLFIPCILHVMTLLHDTLLCAAVYCHVVG